jgi:hypothetical protein
MSRYAVLILAYICLDGVNIYEEYSIRKKKAVGIRIKEIENTIINIFICYIKLRMKMNIWSARHYSPPRDISFDLFSWAAETSETNSLTIAASNAPTYLPSRVLAQQQYNDSWPRSLTSTGSGFATNGQSRGHSRCTSLYLSQCNCKLSRQQ